MLGLLVLAYGLLAMRVRLRAEVSLFGGQGSLSLSADALGATLRFDAVLQADARGLHVLPRYGFPFDAGALAGMTPGRLRRPLPYVRAALRAGRFERLALHVRLGLGDAGATAVAAGTVRALAAALLVPIQGGAPPDVRVEAAFGGAELAAHARCIFSFQPGDIMLAVLKTAASKTGREGFGWKSIPLKA